LLANVNVPVAAPTVVGVNFTWIEIAMVGFSVTGNVAPENVKPAPVMLAELTVTGEVPVDVSVNCIVAGVPTGSSPKFKVAALRVNTGFVELTPAPLRLTVAELPTDELLEIVMVPFEAPATVGLKLT